MGKYLVLKEFFFNEDEDEFLIIKGRLAGFWGWLLSLHNASFICNKQFLKYEVSGVRYNIPLAHISCVTYGRSKSTGLLIIGILIILGGIVGGFFTGGLASLISIVGIIFIISYLRSNNMQFSICVNENKPLVTIKTKTGTLGGQTVNANNYELAVNVLTKAVLAKC